jgi:Ca2+-binding EF-hand superfamily protein
MEPGRNLADFDLDEDGKISFDEFLAYYAPSIKNLLRVQPSANRDNLAEKMTDGMFKLLDRDGDGKLSKAELNEAEKLIALFDQNEDECLSALEIVPNLFSSAQTPASTNKFNPLAAARPQPNEPLQFYRVGTITDAVVEQFLLRYDKDKNLRLSKAESGFDDDTFNALDKDGSGELTISELMAWKDLPPDINLELSLSQKQDECAIKFLPLPDGKPAPLVAAVKVSASGKAFVHMGRQQIDLSVFGNAAVQAAPNQSYLPLFEQADPDNKGYIEEKNLLGPQFQFLRVIFDVVDRDGDGKVTKQEFINYFELQKSFTSVPLILTHLTQTPSLFSLIDTDGDGRLSVRELRNSWNRLKDLEPAGTEHITRSALRPHVTVRFVRVNQNLLAVAGTNYNPNVQTPTKGPLWFRKMDRNSDGDLSRSEFPGRPEEFNKLDLDHDGLISLEEAEAAEKHYRKAKVEKKIERK